jgi:hypothetical protein
MICTSSGKSVALKHWHSRGPERENDMTLDGIVQNGTIVLNDGATLPEGTPVKVTINQNRQASKAAQEKLLTDTVFFHSATIDELAAVQGVTAPCSFDDLLGGWPEDERGDEFEEAVAGWRKEDARPGAF